MKAIREAVNLKCMATLEVHALHIMKRNTPYMIQFSSVHLHSTTSQ